MKSYLEESLTVRFFMFVATVYAASFTNKAVKSVKAWCENSFINKCIVRYLEKKPAAEYTISYRFLAIISRKIDAVVGKIHLLFFRSFNYSVTSSVYESVKKEYSKNPNRIFMAFSVPFILGYVLFSTIRGNWSSTGLIKAAVLTVIIALAALTIGQWKNWIKNSALYKLCQYIWE